MKHDTNIDFVLPWVDGSNSEWKTRYDKFRGSNGDTREIRFRNWDLLRYWFRSIEKYTPWFHKIHFITSGELPDWINLDNPKLNWVKHEDYIPQEYLPTFSSHTIEMNIHRIENLSDKYVYFNDDFFIIRTLSKSRFFQKNLPCDYAVMAAKPASGGIAHIVLNDLDVINRNFEKHKAINKHLAKWISPKYGKGLLNNLLLYPWKEFSGFIDPHIPYAFNKSTLPEIWDKESGILNKTCLSKFRTNEDVNQWLVRYWQLAEGNFYPKNIKSKTLCIDINETTLQSICENIEHQRVEILCLNDSEEITDFEKCKSDIIKSFRSILPEKSSFEKD